ncbi:ABC transporter permease [Candidatus Albibeggiatoa sp. nov. NOAA]|uniref:ABC transporter permease n=1 Tax=Candidatus Albibeggiatoa sp. nov. NOAA TaxID=3162724 RepID=UPI0032F2F079|nr:ABC transporter permease [Thiotrichaceae bacterium]
MNGYGLYTLFSKEMWRFLKVSTQTLLAPIVTVLLYLLVFSSVLSGNIEIYDGVSYASFLIPGLIMMSITQNAFANSSSSLIQSKMMGNLVFMLLAPLSSLEFYIAFVGAAIMRGLFVGIGVWLASIFFVQLPVHSFAIILGFAVLGSAMLGATGIIVALWAEKWDHIAGFTNFVIIPASFLSGVFYSIYSLPSFWQQVSYFNPFFYIIDGFRYGFLGVSDANIMTSFLVTLSFFIIVSVVCLWLLEIGYKIRE